MVREGPGAQVGATWAPKSHPRGVRTAKNRVRRAKVAPSESCCLSELWCGMHRDRKSDQVGSTNYLSDKSYE